MSGTEVFWYSTEVFSMVLMYFATALKRVKGTKCLNYEATHMSQQAFHNITLLLASLFNTHLLLFSVSLNCPICRDQCLLRLKIIPLDVHHTYMDSNTSCFIAYWHVDVKTSFHVYITCTSWRCFFYVTVN